MGFCDITLVHQTGRYSNRRPPAKTLLGIGVQYADQLEEMRQLLEDTKRLLRHETGTPGPSYNVARAVRRGKTSSTMQTPGRSRAASPQPLAGPTPSRVWGSALGLCAWLSGGRARNSGRGVPVGRPAGPDRKRRGLRRLPHMVRSRRPRDVGGDRSAVLMSTERMPDLRAALAPREPSVG